jgi:intracellular multiplication protein IcmE
MAGKKENLKALFTNTRSRVIIVFTAILLIVAVVVGITQFIKRGDKSSLASDVPITPGIQSIPGAIDPTVEYAKLQEAQNVDQAQSALKTGTSAIPTIVRSQALGSGVQVIGGEAGDGGPGFSALAREDEAGLQRSAWIQTLQNSSCSKDSVNKVVTEGASLTDLKSACSCIQLKDNGYQLANLQQVCSCKELKAAGFNARQLKDIGYTAGRLRSCGFDACELRSAGFSAQEMKDGGFSDGELKGAGFSDAEIARASGLPDGITEADVRNAGCQVAALTKLRAAGVSASAIRRISGCTAAQLKAAGYDAQALKDAGFTAADLRNAGFTPAELRQAGFSARDLLNAGFTPDDLARAGYSPAAIMAAESELPPGITPADIQKAGCDVDALKDERIAGVSAKLIRQYAGCSAQALKAAGFTDADLANAGFTPQQIAAIPVVSDEAMRAAGCDADKLKVLLNEGVSAKRIHDLNGCSAAQLKAAGFDAKSLLNAGFTPAELAAAGFTPEQISTAQTASDAAIRAAGCDPQKLKILFNQGVSAKRIHDLNGCSAAQLKAAGYDAKDLLAAGFTPSDLLAAGFTPQQINAASLNSDDAIRAAGCDPAKLTALFAAGVSAKRIHDLNGCSPAQLKAAGYDAKALLDAGFTPEELAAAGFTPQQLTQAGISPAALIAAGRSGDCSVSSLTAARKAGVSATTIRQTLGCGASAMKAAGYTAAELRAAGFTAAELKNAGFTAAELKAAGFSAKELRDAGFTAQQLKEAGFTAQQLKDAGFSAADLKAAGFTASQLKAAGFSAKDLKDAGFSANDLRAAGFSAKDLKDAGFSASELRRAGFSPTDLKNAGYSTDQLKQAGFSTAALASAGIDSSQVAGLGSPDQLQGTVSTMPAIPGYQSPATDANGVQAANSQQLQDIMKRQTQQLADQKYQQKIQQRTSDMMSAANQSLQNWKKVSTQVYTQGTEVVAKKDASGVVVNNQTGEIISQNGMNGTSVPQKALIKTGDILFGVIDTSINSDEPGPILATIVSGKLKGAKLIGSFNLPSNANKMVISFTTMSVPGASRSVSISAYAIDADTARTALASNTNHHYLLRYGSLFASSFLEGFGNAFQSANTTVTVGGTGGGDNITVQNGIGRSALDNAIIGLATVGQSWGQVAQQQFNTPTTVEVYSGTGVGILFTQDLTSL